MEIAELPVSAKRCREIARLQCAGNSDETICQSLQLDRSVIEFLNEDAWFKEIRKRMRAGMTDYRRTKLSRMSSVALDAIEKELKYFVEKDTPGYHTEELIRITDMLCKYAQKADDADQGKSFTEAAVAEHFEQLVYAIQSKFGNDPRIGQAIVDFYKNAEPGSAADKQYSAVEGAVAAYK